MKNTMLLLALFVSVAGFSQKKDFDLPKGNQEFAKKQYAEAEADYRISKGNNSKRATASYNLGNAIYKQDQAAEAKYAYEKAIETAKGKQQKHSAYHNIGNVYMKEKEYSKAVDAYKDALRNNPKDEQTRYNYALAKKMLGDSPNKHDNKKDDKKDKNKKDQPKEDKKDKPKEGDDKKDNKGKPKDDKGNPKPQPKQGDASQQRMKVLLDAVNNEEKKIQDKVKGEKIKGKQTDNEKDW